MNFDPKQQWRCEEGFYLTSHPSRLPKLLAHYELYKSILDLPGCIVECGVFRGLSLIRFCTFREILESPYSRKVIGFDAFGEFPAQDNAEDKAFADRFAGVAGDGLSVEELEEIFSHKEFTNYEFVQGDIINTVPEYVSKHPELKISLLHIDVDVYKPTVVVLNQLFDKVVRGGLVVFDDFGMVAGETRAIDEFFIDRGGIIEKLPISHIPAFIRKK